jgi:hypothetical protein
MSGRYVIQRFYERLTANEKSKFYAEHHVCFYDMRHDIHTGNVGKTKAGDLVAFDW